MKRSDLLPIRVLFEVFNNLLYYFQQRVCYYLGVGYVQ